MAIVNYVVEHIRFIEYASEEKLKGSVMLLWYALMHQMNQRAQGNMWPEEFVRIDNDRLLSYLPMEYDTFAAARNKLKQLGRIDYIPGERNKTNPAYKMIYFYPNYVRNRTEEDGNNNPSPLTMPMSGEPAENWVIGYPKISDNIGGKNGFYPEKSDNEPGKQGGKPGGKLPGNDPGKAGDIYYKHKQYTQTGILNILPEEEEEAAEATTSARVREEEADPVPNRRKRTGEIKAAFAGLFGRKATNKEAERILMFCHLTGMQDATAIRAMEKAAECGPGSPVDYTLTILEDWQKAHVLQPGQVDEYLRERETWKNAPPCEIVDMVHDMTEADERRRKDNIAKGIEKAR